MANETFDVARDGCWSGFKAPAENTISACVLESAYTRSGCPPDRAEIRCSALENVMHISNAASGVLSCLSTKDACFLRLTSTNLRSIVAAHAWEDTTSLIHGDLVSWRACFPVARAANLHFRRKMKHEDFIALRGITRLNLDNVRRWPNAAFVHLDGIKELSMRCWRLDGLCGHAFMHLRGIRKLDMQECSGVSLCEDCFRWLSGIEDLNISGNPRYALKFTDRALSHLKGIRRLHMRHCDGSAITNTGLKNIAGVQELDISGCASWDISDEGFLT
jgi:hypothetical protein